MIGDEFAFGELCDLYVSFPLVLNREGPFIHNSNFMRAIFILPVQCFSVPQSFDSYQGNELLYVLLFNVVRIKQANLYKLLYRLDLSALAQLSQLVNMLLCQDCIDSLGIEAKRCLIPFGERDELGHCKGHFVVGKAFFDNVEPSQWFADLTEPKGQFINGVEEPLATKFFLDPAEGLLKDAQQDMQRLLDQSAYTSSFCGASIALMRVSALQNLVYFCSIIDNYNSLMQNNLSSLEDIENTEPRDLSVERHFGNTLPLSWRDDGEPKYLLGPHYIMFLLTLLLSSLVFIVMGISVVSNAKGKQLQMGVGLTLSLVFYIYCYLKVGFSNPGLASSWSQPPEQAKSDYRYCVPCRIVRPLRTVHCYSCDICIHQYDHHCPWVGKCIGRDNLCIFKQFIFSIIQLFCAFALCLYVSSLYQESKPLVPKT